MYLHACAHECECPSCGQAAGLGAAPPVQLVEQAQEDQRALLEDLLDLVGKLALLINLAK